MRSTFTNLFQLATIAGLIACTQVKTEPNATTAAAQDKVVENNLDDTVIINGVVAKERPEYCGNFTLLDDKADSGSKMGTWATHNWNALISSSFKDIQVEINGPCHYRLIDTTYRQNYDLKTNGEWNEVGQNTLFFLKNRVISKKVRANQLPFFMNKLESIRYRVRFFETQEYGVLPIADLEFRFNLENFEPIVRVSAVLEDTGYPFGWSYVWNDAKLMPGTKLLGVAVPEIALNTANTTFDVLLKNLLMKASSSYSIY